MDTNTACVLVFATFFGLPVLTVGAVVITRMILDYKEGRK